MPIGDAVGELGDLFDLNLAAQLLDRRPERFVLAQRAQTLFGMGHALVAMDRDVPTHLAAGHLPGANQVDPVALHGGHDGVGVEIDEQVKGGVGDRLDSVSDLEEYGHDVLRELSCRFVAG